MTLEANSNNVTSKKNVGVSPKSTNKGGDMNKTTATCRVKRYNLDVPVELHEALDKLATERHMTVAQLTRKAYEMLLVVDSLDLDKEGQLIYRNGGIEQRLVWGKY